MLAIRALSATLNPVQITLTEPRWSDGETVEAAGSCHGRSDGLVRCKFPGIPDRPAGERHWSCEYSSDQCLLGFESYGPDNGPPGRCERATFNRALERGRRCGPWGERDAIPRSPTSLHILL